MGEETQRRKATYSTLERPFTTIKEKGGSHKGAAWIRRKILTKFQQLKRVLCFSFWKIPRVD